LSGTDIKAKGIFSISADLKRVLIGKECSAPGPNDDFAFAL
jgi:hypothetical protein